MRLNDNLIALIVARYGLLEMHNYRFDINNAFTNKRFKATGFKPISIVITLIEKIHYCLCRLTTGYLVRFGL